MRERKSNQPLLSIQYLRAIAALMVVFHHAINKKLWLFNPLENYTALAMGVDIFFVISGFIMYVAARNEKPAEFLEKRIIRIVPLYWVATIAFVAVRTKFHFSAISGDECIHILKSLAFVPHYSHEHTDKIWPYLVPGWTLNYEMFFYLIFFIALTMERVVLITSTVILTLLLAGQWFAFKSPVGITYTSPMMLEFLIGVWLGYGYTHLKSLPNLAWLMPVGLIGILTLPLIKAFFPTQLGQIIFSSMIVAGAATLGQNTPKNNLAKLLGDASYAIYLTHIVISIRLANVLFQKIPVTGWTQFVLYVTTALIFSTIIGIAVHSYVEKPMIRWLRSRPISLLSNKKVSS